MNLYLLSTGTTTRYKLHSEQDSKVQRMALTAALDNINTIYTVAFLTMSRFNVLASLINRSAVVNAEVTVQEIPRSSSG